MQLAKFLEMKTSTVTSLRYKMKRKGLYFQCMIPNFPLIGAELMTFSYVKFTAHPGMEQKLREAHRVMNSPEFTYGISEENQDIFVQICTNYTCCRKNIDSVEKAFKDISHLEKHIQTVYFPFQISEFPNYFNFCPLIQSTFDISCPTHEEETEQSFFAKECSTPDMSKKEKAVFYGLVRYPDLNDIELSNRIKASRMTIGKTRKKFLQQSLLRPVNILNLAYLGFELLMVTHAKFNTRLSDGLKYYVPKLLRSIGHSIFTAYSRNEIVMMTPYLNYNHYKEVYAKFTETYNELDIFEEPPTRIMFSTKNSVVTKNHVYTDITRKCLGITPDDVFRES